MNEIDMRRMPSRGKVRTNICSVMSTLVLAGAGALSPLSCDGSSKDAGAAGCGDASPRKDAAAGWQGTGGHRSSSGGASGVGETDGSSEDGRAEATTAFVGWPPSTPTADRQCVPNCDVDTCGSLCPATQTLVGASGVNGNTELVGLPCDSGCCASNVAVPWQLPTESTHHFSPGSGYTAVAASASGTLYFATCGGDLGAPGECTQLGCGRDLLVAETTKLDGTVVRGGAFPDQAITSTAPGGQAYDPQFAFGKWGGKDALFVAYLAIGRSEFSPDAGYTVNTFFHLRLGTKVAGTWTFETIDDAPCDSGLLTAAYTIGEAKSPFLAADAQGAPVVLLGDHIVRKRDTGEWESMCLPGPTNGGGQAITTDASGALYVARADRDGNLRISRRDSVGNWWTEEVTGSLQLVHYNDGPGAMALAAGGGTLHLVYHGRAGIYYARRVGTTWEQHRMISNFSVTSLALQLDACGSPHVAAYVSDYLNCGQNYYYRWTTAGWRGAKLNGDQCNSGPTISGGLALTTTEAYMSFWTSSPFQTNPSFFGVGIPLR